MAKDLNNFPNIGTLTFRCAGVESVPVFAIAGAALGTCSASRKYGTVVKVTELAGRNRDGGLAGRMVKKKITQLKISKINLVAHQIQMIIRQEFIAGKPGIFATGANFKK